MSAGWLLVQERLSSLGDNMFGGGIYLAENSSKSFLYTSCPKCNRQVCVRDVRACVRIHASVCVVCACVLARLCVVLVYIFLRIFAQRSRQVHR